MKLLRFGTDGFGALRGYYSFDPERVTVLVDDNERGKTTLLAAIAAALYGLDDNRRSHRVITPLDRWRPWEGGEYTVELELECGGEQYRIRRDFHRGTVEVWNGRGQDVTAEFREGKDQYPVGRTLLGLDGGEFEKCALVRQRDLFDVVPADERERRASTLRARLEAVADSRMGDTMASEALAHLEGALRRYTCPEVEFTGTVDNAIKQLELKRAALETELKTLEHDVSTIAGPLGELADMGEEERRLREALAALEGERRTGLAADALGQLDEDRKRRAEVEALRREAESLEPDAHIPLEAESQLRETIAKLEAAQSKVVELERRRREEIARQRSALEEERAGLKVFEAGTAADADRCVTLAAEIRRAAEDEATVRDEIFNLRDSLATAGHDPERLQWLGHRLGKLTESDHALLRRQSELALSHQTEVAGLENQRTGSSETLRQIDAQRNRWSLPGWFLLAVGLAGIVAGAAVVALQGLPVLSTTFFVAGALMLGTGVALVTLGRRVREDEREEALRKLSDAQRRLNLLKHQRTETQAGLEALAGEMGYRDHVELLREWNELVRLREESAPTLQAQQQLIALQSRHLQVVEEARALLQGFGDIEPTPGNLEQVAGYLRRLEGIRHQVAALARDDPWFDEQKRVDEAMAAGLKERAQRILQSAALAHDPDRSWAEHVADLAERVKRKARYVTLVGELIPAAEQRLLPEVRVAELEGRRALAEGAAGADTARRPALEIEEESARVRERLDHIQKRRGDLRVQVEEISRRYHGEHPDKRIQLERVEQALERARRFQVSVETASRTIQSVAAETRRRWADYLNQRVGELVGRTGGRIEQIRFGDDLDFSVRLPGGHQVARGKADQQLSCAARDQLYLAVRLAISEFLSRGQAALPLLLDDVFATSDDERARNGMRLLVEHLSGRHQIILVTCHRQRYERLGELDRELYAERVQWLGTRSAGDSSLGSLSLRGPRSSNG